MSSAAFSDFIADLMRPLGAVQRRRMFGGTGFFRDGQMFALIAADTLYFKTDAETAAVFEAEGCGPFTYGTKDGVRSIASYRRAPERLFDDPEAFVAFAAAAVDVAVRAAATSRRRPSAAGRSKRSAED